MVAPGYLSRIAAATRAVVVEPDTGHPPVVDQEAAIGVTVEGQTHIGARGSTIRCCRATRFAGWIGSAG